MVIMPWFRFWLCQKLRCHGGASAEASKLLLDKIGANRTARHKFLVLLKEMYPNLSIPELDEQEHSHTQT